MEGILISIFNTIIFFLSLIIVIGSGALEVYFQSYVIQHDSSCILYFWGKNILYTLERHGGLGAKS